MGFILKRKFLYSLLFLTVPFVSPAQQGETNFKTLCASCHTIGGGKLVGPDLSGIMQKRDRAWVSKFIKNSGQMISDGDANAVSIAKEYNNMLMPPSTLSDAEIEDVIKYIESKSGGSSTPAVVVDYLKNSKDDNIRNGYKLFIGQKPFKKSGASCISCHDVDQYGSGGKFAKNLTQSFNTLKADGIKAMLTSPAFPSMINSYKNNPLTEEEVFDLTSYLRATATNKLPKEINKKACLSSGFLIFGGLGFLGFFIIFFVIYRMRKRGSVNDEIIDRQLNASN